MPFLRFAAVLALAVWIGGLAVVAGVGAPTIFEVLQARDPASGRELAGTLFGEILARAQYVGWACGLIVLLSLVARAALGPRPARWKIRLWIAALMLAASVGVSFSIAPRIDAIRTSVTGPVASLPDDDPRKRTFGWLHGLSTAVLGLTVVGGVVLLWTELRDTP